MNFADYKCLESLLIDGNKIAMESKSDFQKVDPKEGSTIQIKFLNKTFDVKVAYGSSYEKDGWTLGNINILKKQAAAINKILPMINDLSLKHKSDIIKAIQKDAKDYYGKELPDDLNVFDYFVPKEIYVPNRYTRKNDRIIGIIDPRYKFDPEHGAGIEFTNEKYTNGPIQSDYFY